MSGESGESLSLSRSTMIRVMLQGNATRTSKTREKNINERRKYSSSTPDLRATSKARHARRLCIDLVHVSAISVP